MKRDRIEAEFKGMPFMAGDGLYSDMSNNESFRRGGLHHLSRAVKAEMHDAAVCIIHEDMFRHIDNRSVLNKQLRIGYLLLKRAYCEGDKEKEGLFVEEAARIWKLTSEERDRILDTPLSAGATNESPNADASGTRADDAGEPHRAITFSQEFVEGLRGLFEEWRPWMEDFWEWIEWQVLDQANMPYYSEEEALRFLEDVTPVRLRIRKLTPRECGRLMDVSEPDIDKIEGCGVSRSAQYKLYGNSIVVAPMEFMFRNLLVDEYRNRREADKKGQLSLF